MTFTFPQTAQEFWIMLVPMLTVLLGLGFLIVPAKILNFMGLRALAARPEAIGEGRSSFAGGLLALGLGCLLLQDPIALQPGLNFALALAWSVAAFGRILQIAFDGGWRKRIQMRLLLALVMAGIMWSVTEVPTLLCVEYFSTNCHAPTDLRSWFLAAVALLTLGLGLIALFLPKLALGILKLEYRMTAPFAVGETRGTLAGFYIALGATYLASPQPVDFIALVLGAAWLLTGLGRFVSMIFDRGFTPYNFVGTAFETGIGIVVIGFVLQLF